MTANQAVNKLINAEMNLGKHGNNDAAAALRSERMKLQSAMTERGISKAEKSASIGRQQSKALHTLDMWADYLR